MKIEISPIYLPASLGVQRNAPRPAADRQPDYIDRFDSKTLYYDVFHYRDRIVLSGPPLLNLSPIMHSARISLDGVLLRSAPHLVDKWKTQRSFIPAIGNETSLQIDAGWVQANVVIQPNNSNLFKGRKVLFTLSKDNDKVWIKDWITYYVKAHGIDAVLFYDNASDIYSSDELRELIASVPGVMSSLVVDWPFKYGPGAGPAGAWDSDFCQYSAIEHARRRFLSTCYGVINADIDELVVSSDNSTVFEHLDRSPTGAILYDGIWVETAGGPKDRLPRHRDFVYNDTRRAPCTKKWTIKPSLIPEEIQVNVHSFGKGFNPKNVSTLRHRHFKGVNSNWKNNRTAYVKFDPAHHVKDETFEVLATQIWED